MPGIDDVLRQQDEIIARVGWAVMHILPTDDDPDTTTPYAYTVGLTARFAPEFVITGLPPQIAQGLLNDLASRVFHGAGPIAHGSRVTDLIVGFDAVIVNGTATDEVFPGVAVARYGADQVRLQQIVWPDPQGRFPWDTGYSITAGGQPVIGTP